jgi:formamidopyrimidine-DNA glycosylase
MIELPDVERMIDAFAGYATGKTVSVVLVDDAETVDLDAERAAEQIQGHAIDTVERHGKYVVLRFRSEVSLVFDMGTDGEVYLESQTAPPRETSKIRLQFAAGRELRFASSGTAGDVYLLEGDDFSGLGVLDNLGLDPLSEELTASRFIQLASTRGRSSLKGLLMNEEVVAGIGNEYADEICFQASIRPDCKIADLSPEQLTLVHKYLRRVLRRATLHWQAAHSDPGWLINRRRPGHTCPRCMTTLESLSLVGKRTYLCPRCQRAA